MFEKTFRLNPSYSITRFDELNERQRRVFVHLINNKDLYGVLHAPREARLTVKAINKELAEFLRQFREPMSLDHAFARFSRGTRGEKERYIKQLVLDCVLEVETDDGFISGVEAVNRVLASTPADRRSPGETETARNHIQALSERGIRMALDSVHSAPRDLTIFLYNLNRIPISRRWRTRLPDDAAVARYLDLGDDGSWPGMPDHVKPRPIRYDENGEPHFFDLHWRSWNFGDRKHSRDELSYKVYFSPRPEDLPEVLGIVREAAADADPHFMKVGRTLGDIFRADKLLVYFSDYTQACRFASDLSQRLASFRFQGTPFSYQVGLDSGLVSLGVDPPQKIAEAYSWRLYLTTKLAMAIYGARREKAGNPFDHIHMYLRLLGIDGEKWCPLSKDWRMEFRISEEEYEESRPKS